MHISMKGSGEGRELKEDKNHGHGMVCCRRAPHARRYVGPDGTKVGGITRGGMQRAVRAAGGRGGARCRGTGGRAHDGGGGGVPTTTSGRLWDACA